MQPDELGRIMVEMRRELGRRRAVMKGLPPVLGEAEAELEITEELLAEAEHIPITSEERARHAAPLQEAAARCLRLIERL